MYAKNLQVRGCFLTSMEGFVYVWKKLFGRYDLFLYTLKMVCMIARHHVLCHSSVAVCFLILHRNVFFFFLCEGSPGEHRERTNQQADKVEASHQYLIRNLIEVLFAISVMFIPWSLSQQWFLFKFETWNQKAQLRNNIMVWVLSFEVLDKRLSCNKMRDFWFLVSRHPSASCTVGNSVGNSPAPQHRSDWHQLHTLSVLIQDKKLHYTLTIWLIFSSCSISLRIIAGQ